jgi:hypothetical protein
MQNLYADPYHKNMDDRRMDEFIISPGVKGAG